MTRSEPYSLVIGEELALIRDALACLCESSGRFRVAGLVSDGESALRLLEGKQPELALLDLNLPNLFTLEIIRQAREGGIPSRAVVYSSRKDRKTVLEVLRAGGQGYFVKSAGGAALLDCLQQVAEGGIYVSPQIDLRSLFSSARRGGGIDDPLSSLSAREYQVFNLMVEGIRAKEIAARLNLSPKTVDTYRAGLMRKLDVTDIAGLVKFAIQRGIIHA
jgi:DNA-binding NarL/FixJ family response regulator